MESTRYYFKIITKLTSICQNVFWIKYKIIIIRIPASDEPGEYVIPAKYENSRLPKVPTNNRYLLDKNHTEENYYHIYENIDMETEFGDVTRTGYIPKRPAFFAFFFKNKEK